MLGGFAALTLLALVVVYTATADLSFSLKKTAPPQVRESITLDPKPKIEVAEQAEKPIQSPSVAGTHIEVESVEEKEQINPATLYLLINAHRKEHHLSSLRVHQALELSSRRKLEDMRSNNYWRHENPQGVLDWSIFDSSGYHFSSAGENLSFANNTAWSVFDSWVHSPTHNAELLKAEYEDMGLAVDCENYREAGEKKCAVVLHLGRQQ